MILASAILDRADDLLTDAGNVHWTQPEKLRWLSDAQREVVVYKPSATAITEAFQLVSGKTLQTIPAAGACLLDLTRNLGANGTTPGRAIRVIDRALMDAQAPNWHTDPPAASIDHYMFDPRVPRQFYVYPAPSAAIYVELSYAKMPVELTTVTDPLAVDDLYANACLDYVLSRAFAKDAEFAGNLNRALLHYNAFAQAVGIRGMSEAANKPRWVKAGEA